MKRVGFSSIIAAATLLLIPLAGAQQGGGEEAVMTQLIGSWRLVRFNSITEAGDAVRRPYSVGRISYAAGGQMTAQLMPEGWGDDADADDNDNDSDYDNVYTAYFGRYSVDLGRQAIFHHVEGAYNRDMLGQSMPRYFELSDDGNTLVLEVRNDGRTTARLRWARIVEEE